MDYNVRININKNFYERESIEKDNIIRKDAFSDMNQFVFLESVIDDIKNLINFDISNLIIYDKIISKNENNNSLIITFDIDNAFDIYQIIINNKDCVVDIIFKYSIISKFKIDTYHIEKINVMMSLMSQSYFIQNEHWKFFIEYVNDFYKNKSFIRDNKLSSIINDDENINFYRQLKTMKYIFDSDQISNLIEEVSKLSIKEVFKIKKRVYKDDGLYN